MQYLQWIAHLLQTYYWLVMPLALLFLLLYGIANWTISVYGKQNAKLTSCTKSMINGKTNMAKIVKTLPTEYARQYRSYVNSNANKPCQTFEFVPVKGKRKLIKLMVLSTIVACWYFVLYLQNFNSSNYLAFFLAYLLTFVVVAFFVRYTGKCDEKHARKVFAKFVATLGQYHGNMVSSVNNVSSKVQTLAKGTVTDNTITQVAQLLNSCSNNDRTVTQQRQLNNALNSLLNGYSQNNVVTDNCN